MIISNRRSLLTLAYAELQLQEFAAAEASAIKASKMLGETAPDTYMFGVDPVPPGPRYAVTGT